jgi:hypothetical protein
MGSGEIGELLGLSRQRVQQLAERIDALAVLLRCLFLAADVTVVAESE